jgi:hypothetical protein
MTREALREYAEVMRGRYREAGSKAQKGALLKEFCEVSGYHRKAAIRLFTQHRSVQVPRRSPGRPKCYGPEVVRALRVTWEASGRIGAKRLAPFLPDLVTCLERHHELTLSVSQREQLLGISASTIDRVLKPFRLSVRRQPHRNSASPALLRNRIPVHTFATLRGLPVGHLEFDLVLHCGMSAEGFFLTTLVGVDIASGWVSLRAVWGKGQQRVQGGVARVQQQLPFPLLGLHSDNGGEFINAVLFRFAQEQELQFTRSRLYHKNDQPHVEQKNGHLVRAVIGYGRYSTQQAYQQLEHIYELLCLHANLFQPLSKLTGREYAGDKVTKHYDRPQTPYQRLLAAGVLDESAQRRLEELYVSLNPLQLWRWIEEEVDKLWPMESLDPASARAARLEQELTQAAEQALLADEAEAGPQPHHR